VTLVILARFASAGPADMRGGAFFSVFLSGA
jgi:hypothetical protein